MGGNKNRSGDLGPTRLPRFGGCRSDASTLSPQSFSLEPDDNHATEVYTSSAAAVAALTAMSIAVMTPMVTVVVILMVSVLTAPIGGVVVVASIMPCSTSISCPV